MNNADNINAVLKAENRKSGIPYGLATQTLLEQLLAVCSHLREASQCQTSFLNAIKKSVGVVWAVLCDIPPNFVKVAFGFWPLQQTGHPDFILPLVAQKVALGLAS
jgi:hypothetical protein